MYTATVGSVIIFCVFDIIVSSMPKSRFLKNFQSKYKNWMRRELKKEIEEICGREINFFLDFYNYGRISENDLPTRISIH